MNCDTARLLLAFHRPHAAELGPDDARTLDEHLSSCPRCGTRARQVQEFDKAVAAVMAAVPLPIGVRERLLAKVTNLQSARRRQWAVYAAAAVVLLAVGIGLWRYAAQNQPVTWADVQGWCPQPSRSDPSVPQIYLARLPGFHLDDSVSAQLQWPYVVAAYVEECDGKKVGILEMVKGDARARAFLVPQKNAASLLTDDPGYPGRAVLLRPPVDSATCVLVLVALQGDPHTFLRAPQLPSGG